VIWQNRSFYIGIGGLSKVANQNQQNVVTLFPKGSTTAAATQTVTGGCPTGSSYWDLGFRGDTDVTSHATSGFVPNNSVLSMATTTSYGGSNDANTTPAFTSQYCNGSRSPPELGAGGYAVPPGVNEFNAFPNPVFTLSPAGVVDEGNNWVNVNWGPLALTSPTTNAVLGNYAPTGTQSTSSAIDHGSPNPPAGSDTNAPTVAAPKDDFFGNVRPAGTAYDIGAVEVPAQSSLAVLSVTGGPLTFTAGVGVTSPAQTLTLGNTGSASSSLGAIAFSNTAFSRPTGNAGGTCGTTLNMNATCTINVVFTPPAAAPANGTLSIVADVPVTGSPVMLSGTGVASVSSASLTPINWAPTATRGCTTGFAGLGGSCPTQIFQLRNTGNVPLTGITQGVLGGANSNEFSVTRLLSTCGPAGGGQFFGATTLAPGAACLLTVRFTPSTSQSTGNQSATISITDVAGTQTAILNGTAN
jgi:hypothetical protein